MKYFMYRNRDAGDAYEQALINSGYLSAITLSDADFVLYDFEYFDRRQELKDFLKTKPGFIYPHTPYSFWLWDGIYKPFPVKCNFAVTEITKQSMIDYGYPYPVESVGFSSCEIKEYRPFNFKNKLPDLLIAPPHILKATGQYPSPAQPDVIKTAIDFVIQHRQRFGQITLRYAYNLDGLPYNTDHYNKLDIDLHCVQEEGMTIQSAVDDIMNADIVYACNTISYLAIASGRPTFTFNEKGLPRNSQRSVLNYNLYKKTFEYPFDLRLLNYSITDIEDYCKFESAQLRWWRECNIGRPFDADKFISIIEKNI